MKLPLFFKVAVMVWFPGMSVGEVNILATIGILELVPLLARTCTGVDESNRISTTAKGRDVTEYTAPTAMPVPINKSLEHHCIFLRCQPSNVKETEEFSKVVQWDVAIHWGDPSWFIAPTLGFSEFQSPM